MSRALALCVACEQYIRRVQTLWCTLTSLTPEFPPRPRPRPYRGSTVRSAPGFSQFPAGRSAVRRGDVCLRLRRQARHISHARRSQERCRHRSTNHTAHAAFSLPVSFPAFGYSYLPCLHFPSRDRPRHARRLSACRREKHPDGREQNASADRPAGCLWPGAMVIRPPDGASASAQGRCEYNSIGSRCGAVVEAAPAPRPLSAHHRYAHGDRRCFWECSF